MKTTLEQQQALLELKKLNHLGINWDMELPVVEWDRIKVRNGNITWLNLDNIQLSELPESICKLVNLERLGLSNNQLTSLPKSIGKLVKVEQLYLDNNLKFR